MRLSSAWANSRYQRKKGGFPIPEGVLACQGLNPALIGLREAGLSASLNLVFHPFSDPGNPLVGYLLLDNRQVDRPNRKFQLNLYPRITQDGVGISKVQVKRIRD